MTDDDRNHFAERVGALSAALMALFWMGLGLVFLWFVLFKF